MIDTSALAAAPFTQRDLDLIESDAFVVDRRARHLCAEDYDWPDDPDQAPSWRRIAFWAVVALVLVPAFLAYCGSIRL